MQHAQRSSPPSPCCAAAPTPRTEVPAHILQHGVPNMNLHARLSTAQAGIRPGSTPSSLAKAARAAPAAVACSSQPAGGCRQVYAQVPVSRRQVHAQPHAPPPQVTAGRVGSVPVPFAGSSSPPSARGSTSTAGGSTSGGLIRTGESLHFLLDMEHGYPRNGVGRTTRHGEEGRQHSESRTLLLRPAARIYSPSTPTLTGRVAASPSAGGMSPRVAAVQASPWAHGIACGASGAVMSNLRAVRIAETVDEFLCIRANGPLAVAQALVAAASSAEGCEARFYAPAAGATDGGNADGSATAGVPTQGAGELALVASSASPGVHGAAVPSVGSRPPREFQAALRAALAGEAVRTPAQVAAAAVRTRDGVAKGVLLLATSAIANGVDVPTEAPKPDGLQAAARMWTRLLADRLDRMQMEQRIREYESQEALRELGERLRNTESVEGLAMVLSTEAAAIAQCELLTLFVHDAPREEIWAPPQRSLPSGVCVSATSGLVGHVATQALASKDFGSSVLLDNEPTSSSAWTGSVVTRNLLAVPVLGGGDSELMGVLQASNKLHSPDMSAPPLSALTVNGDASSVGLPAGFGAQDTELMRSLAGLVAKELERLSCQKICEKATLESTASPPHSRSLVEEYYDSAKTSREKRPSLGDLGLNGKTFEKYGQNSPYAQEDLDVRTWRINYWELTERDQLALFTQTLRRCNILHSVTISERVLAQFFEKVREEYKPNPYHNFDHAMSTVHYSYKLLTEAELLDRIEWVDTFALLVGALCHDMGHGGFNNQFEVVTRSELALRYNDVSPLENFHCAKAFEVILGDDGRCNIFGSISSEVFSVVRQRVIGGILKTDMIHHGDFVSKVQAMNLDPVSDGAQNQFLVETILHTADIANAFMPPDISAEWGRLLREEFTVQVTTERRLGLPVTSFMDGLNTPLAAAKSSQGFIDFVVFPLFDPLQQRFPGWAEPKGWLAENRQSAADAIAKATEASS
eukprot:TRINITY_DN72097_c0_g1_i1.p1 TRINITY_DN72097_c0_g1~~TRINITY_DN72097_c0_g1_i1.p1  ORF type:complete len:979 (+),score=188.84 TRINITY_DN72097_c0_g1_i1:226-3162(+)